MKIFGDFRKHHLVLSGILFVTFLLRLPSLFEPFWYGDEGIFAAVARNLNFGGVLYQDAWDNKPPMIYLTYKTIFATFGVSMFWLRLVATIFAVSTAAVIYEIGQKTFGEKRALFATAFFGFLISLRLIEANLALTEIFMILPISLAMLIAILRKFDYLSLFCAGVLFATASLFKQVGALEAAALGIFVFLYTKSFWEFIKKGFILSVGFSIPFLIFIVYFAQKGLLGEFIFGAYTYYQIYLGESPKYQFLINILKFFPILIAIVFGLFMKFRGKVSYLNLFFLWAAFSFLGSFFSGRTYGHYLVQVTPSVSLLLATLPVNFKLKKSSIIFSIAFLIPIVLLVKILFADFGSINLSGQVGYYKNFLEFASGKKSVENYNNYFDSNVNNIMALNDFLISRNATGKSVYIWGDYPWLYAISDLKNPSRYVTSFHVFGVPGGREEVIADLKEKKPIYIIKPERSIGYFPELEKLLFDAYTLDSRIENSEVFVRNE